jgi:hypothetical protein
LTVPALLALCAAVLGAAVLFGGDAHGGLSAGNFFGGAAQPAAAAVTPSPGVLFHPIPAHVHPDVREALRVRAERTVLYEQAARREAARDKRQEAAQDAAQAAAAYAAAHPSPSPQPSAQSPVMPAQPAGAVSTSGMAAFEACVIQNESGGNPTAVNPSSGAGGLFQFLPSTWANLGLGYPGGAQTAPVSVQEQGFQILYSEAGTAPWAGDGCA